MNKEERRNLERHEFAMRLGIHDPDTCPACDQDDWLPVTPGTSEGEQP